MKSYSSYQFTLFRIILGLYLIVHFAMLIPFASELWSNEGVITNSHLNFTYGIIPNVLERYDSPLTIECFIAFLLLLSFFFMIGISRQISSFLLWIGWIWLFNRNNFISNPSIPVVGWLLLICTVIPSGEPSSFFRKKEGAWEISPILFYGAWIIMATGYTISGIDKLHSPSWANGDALYFLLDNPLARNWFLRDWMMALPHQLLQLMSWLILGCEIVFLPLSLWHKTRPFAWLSMVLMHLGILLIVDFADLTIGMLMIHIFTFDGRWLQSKTKTTSIVFFDGVCGLCNKFIDFVIREDLSHNYDFAPLQGDTANKEIPIVVRQLSTIVLKNGNDIYVKSDAALRIISGMGNIWTIGKLFLLVPKPIRDTVYEWIAKNRHRLSFSASTSCRLPNASEQNRFLR